MAEKIRLCFQVNNFCNLNCSYCYQCNKGHKQMDLCKAKYFIDKFFEKDEKYFKGYFQMPIEGIILDFIGGEATLSMEIVDGVTDYFYKKCIDRGLINWIINSDIWLESNGTTYFKPEVYRFIEKHSVKLDLPITLDGNKALHDTCRKYHDGRGSYDDVEKAIKHYMANFNKVPNSKVTLSPENVSYLYDGIINFIKLGYLSVRCNCCMEDVWDDLSQDEYYHQLIKIYDYIINERSTFSFSPMRDYVNKCNTASCGLYGSMLCLDYDGNLYNCFRYSDVSIANRKPLTLGTVDAGITNTEVLNKLRSRINNAYDEQCKKCSIRSSCENCPAFNYQHTGSLTTNLKTNCRVTHLEAKAFKYFQNRCLEEGFSHPMLNSKNEWNNDLFAQNNLSDIKK